MTTRVVPKSGETISLVDALRRYIAEGKAMTKPQQVAWRKALAHLDRGGDMRARLHGFADALGLEHGKAGARKKTHPYVSTWARAADALIALRQRPKSMRRAEALSSIAAKFGFSEEELDKWSKHKELRAWIATTGAETRRVHEETIQSI